MEILTIFAAFCCIVKLIDQMKYKSKILLKFSVKISGPRQTSKEIIEVNANNLTAAS